MKKPVLYSFRRCPYAMRARFALAYTEQVVQLREVKLSDKPRDMLVHSPKATVPVLVHNDDSVLEESLEIMLWALQKNDPQDWLLKHQPELYEEAMFLIQENDQTFKEYLDHYKYSVRFPEYPVEYYRSQGEVVLSQLETLLARHNYLLRETPCIADIAIFPFVRQFVNVDTDWFFSTAYNNLQRWFNYFMQAPLFKLVMEKHQPWKENDDPVFFPVEE